MSRLLALVVTSAVFLLSPFALGAEVKVEGILKAVDAKERTLTVEKKSAKGTKELALEVAEEAGDLASLKVGDEVSLAYDSTLEVVTKIVNGDVVSDIRLFPDHKSVILDLAFTPDGKHVVVGTGDRTIRTWSTEPGGEKQEPAIVVHAVPEGEQKAFLTALAISSNGQLMASALSDGSVQIWQSDKDNWKPRQALEKLSGITTPVVFSGDGNTLATVERQPGVVRLWDVSGKTVVAKSGPFAPPGANAWSVALANDGSLFIGLLFPQSKEGQVVQWRPESGPRFTPFVKELASVPRSTTISPDGKTLAVGDNGLVRVYSLADKEPLAVIDTNKGQKAVVRVVFSPDGKYLATGGYYSEVQVWNAKTGDAVDSLKGDFGLTNKGVEGLAFSPDGQSLAIGSKDGLLRLWRYRTKPK